MKTYIIEALVTAKTSIAHNGGEQNGVVSQLRREKFVLPNRKVEKIPLISGNSIRGKIRDIAAADILTRKDGSIIQVDSPSFNLLFSGGSLESTGAADLDIEKLKKLREQVPMLSILGGAVGNVILPGKVQIGKMIPICKESVHLIPENIVKKAGTLRSIWDLCQIEMYTRKDDQKNENYKKFLKEPGEDEDKTVIQMQYYVETFAAGTKFFWKICLTDTDDVETGAFLDILQKFADTPYILGADGRIGLGDISIEIIQTKTIDSEIDFKNDDFVKFIQDYEKVKPNSGEYFENSK